MQKRSFQKYRNYNNSNESWQHSQFVKFVASFYILCFLVVTITSCDFERSNNGKFDGNWQLTQLDTLQTSRTADMRGSGIFWCVQHHLLLVRNVYDIEHNIFFRFEKTENTLRLWNPVSDNRAVSDSVVTSSLTLQPYGIQNLDETLIIESFSADNMVLKNEKLRFYFRKF